MQLIRKAWREDDAVLSFEWVLLVTILTIGIVSGLAAARDGIIEELGDIAETALSIDQTYRVDYAPDITIHEPPAFMGGSDSGFIDLDSQFNDDDRVATGFGQDTLEDDDTP